MSRKKERFSTIEELNLSAMSRGISPGRLASEVGFSWKELMPERVGIDLKRTKIELMRNFPGTSPSSEKFPFPCCIPRKLEVI